MRRYLVLLLIATLMLSGCSLAPRKADPVTGRLRVMVLGPVGLEEPKAGWTWADLERAAVKLVEVQANKAKGWAVALPPWALMDLVITAGEGPADPELANLETLLTRLRRLQELHRGLAEDSLGLGDLDSFVTFPRGEVGMLVTYWSNSFVHTKPQFEWSIVPLPRDLTRDGRTPGIVTLAMVASNAEDADNAFAFAWFTAGKGGPDEVVRQPGAPIPGDVDGQVRTEWLALAGLADSGAFALEANDLPAADDPTELVGLLLQEARAVLEAEKTPAEAVRDVEQAHAPLMSKR